MHCELLLYVAWLSHRKGTKDAFSRCRFIVFSEPNDNAALE